MADGRVSLKDQRGRSSPAVTTMARPTIGRRVKSGLVRLVGDDVLFGHELEEIGDRLEDAPAAGVRRAHPVLEAGVDLPVEPLAERGIDEEKEQPRIDEEVEDRFSERPYRIPFHGRDF